MRARRAVLTVVVLLLTLGSAGLGQPAAGAAAPAAASARPAPQLTTVRLAIIPITGFLDYYYAQEQGWFQEEGLAIDLQLMAGGAEILPALIGGSLDIGITNVFSHVLARDQGFDVKAIAGPSVQRRSAPLHAILVRADSPIRSARDIEGRTMATNTLNNIDHLMQQVWLQQNGVDPRRVNFVEIPFPQQPAALAAGRVDVIAPAEPFSTVAQTQGARVIAHHYAEVNETTALAYYAAMADWLARNGDTARRFARAIARADEFLVANPEERRAAAQRNLNLPPEVVARQNFEEWLPRAYLPGIQWWIDVGRRFGLVHNDLKPDDFVWDTIR